MITTEGTLLSEHRFTLGRALFQETAQASASRAPANPPDLPCRLCGLMSPRHRVDGFGGFCSKRHKSEWLVVIYSASFVDRQLNIFVLNLGSGIIHMPEDSSYVDLVCPE